MVPHTVENSISLNKEPFRYPAHPIQSPRAVYEQMSTEQRFDSYYEASLIRTEDFFFFFERASVNLASVEKTFMTNTFLLTLVRLHLMQICNTVGC